MKTIFTNYKVIGFVLVSATIFLGAQTAVLAQGDESGTKLLGITYPVEGLGNCDSKESCHSYCEDGEHMDACISFAKKHGLMTDEEIKRAETFSSKIKGKDGPGGCDSPGSCRVYCENVANLEECVSFSEKNNFKGEQYEHGKKISSYLKSGGAVPGGCAGKVSCEAYCSDFSHAEECFEFAKKVGISQGRKGKDSEGFDGEDHEPTLEQMKKLVELVKIKETPGGCTSRSLCESYCRAEGHFEECAAFGEKMGFLTKEKVDMIRKTGGKGPGGCASEKECRAYCNEPTNRERCFAFAKEHGLLSQEELARMKEGIVRMRQGLANAPEGVRACLSATLGATVLEDIQAGKLMPGPDLGEKMRGCFDKFGEKHDPQEVFERAPEEVKSCLRDKLGVDYENLRLGNMEMTPETGDTMRVCFELARFGQQSEEEQFYEAGGQNSERGAEHADRLKSLLRSAPDEVTSCLKEKLGDKYSTYSQEGMTEPDSGIGNVVRRCFEQFRPQNNEDMRDGNVKREYVQSEGMVGKSERGDTSQTNIRGPRDNNMRGDAQSGWIARLPDEVRSCLKERYGAEYLSLGTKGPTQEMETVLRECHTRLGEQQMGGSQKEVDRGGVFPSFPLKDGTATSGYRVHGVFQRGPGERNPSMQYQDEKIPREPFGAFQGKQYEGMREGQVLPSVPQMAPNIEQDMMPPEGVPMPGGEVR